VYSLLHVLIWNWSLGKIRPWLRTLFPTLQDNQQLKGFSKPVPCISNIESFLFGLLLEMTVHFYEMGVRNLTDFGLALNLISWKPNAIQVQFWQSLLAIHASKVSTVFFNYRSLKHCIASMIVGTKIYS
jgi:hypothetical protein